MLSPLFQAGVRAGLVSAAATAGALAGVGIRHGDWMAAFSSLGIRLLQWWGIADAPRVAAAVAGMGCHALLMIGWGLCFATLTRGRRLSWAIACAIGVAAAAIVSTLFVTPVALGAVRFGGLPTPQLALCLALMIGGLLTGNALASD